LCLRFPRVYSIAKNKSAIVYHSGVWIYEKWLWKVDWRRALFEWEHGEVFGLISLLEGETISLGFVDQWVWKADEDGGYTVSSTYKCLSMSEVGTYGSMYEVFWSIKGLPYSMTTAWRVLVDRLSTHANLERRGILVESNLCVL